MGREFGSNVIDIIILGITTTNKHLSICFLHSILLGTVGDRNRHKCLSVRNLQIHEVLVEFTLEVFLIKW